MQGNFPASLNLVLKHEGGYVDHPLDPGGATNMGITIGTLSEWIGRKALKSEVKNISGTTVSAIYQAKYWDNVRGDELPAGVDFAVFDFAVNSGVRRAGKALQRAVGAKADGIIGPMTLRKVNEFNDDTALIDAICDRRQSFLERLRTFKTFGRGWTRRVSETREAAHEMRGKL